MMGSKPPERGRIEDGWGTDDEVSLVRLRGSTRPDSEGGPRARGDEAKGHGDEARKTLPPPLPESEYVAHMMRRVPTSPRPDAPDEMLLGADPLDLEGLLPPGDEGPLALELDQFLAGVSVVARAATDDADENEEEEDADGDLVSVHDRATPVPAGPSTPVVPPIDDFATPLVPRPPKLGALQSLEDQLRLLELEPDARMDRETLPQGSRFPEDAWGHMDTPPPERAGGGRSSAWPFDPDAPDTKRGLGDTAPPELSMERSSEEPSFVTISDIPLEGGPDRTQEPEWMADVIHVEETEEPRGEAAIIDLGSSRPPGVDAPFGGGEKRPSRAAGGGATPAYGTAPPDPTERIRERFELNDFSGALVLAEAVLEDDPTNAAARRYAEECKDMLLRMYLSRIGDPSQVPRVVMEPEQLRWLTLDHRAGFVLACIDGRSSIDDILDVCGMAALEALRILYELVQQGAISIEPRRPAHRR